MVELACNPYTLEAEPGEGHAQALFGYILS